MGVQEDVKHSATRPASGPRRHWRFVAGTLGGQKRTFLLVVKQQIPLWTPKRTGRQRVYDVVTRVEEAYYWNRITG